MRCSSAYEFAAALEPRLRATLPRGDWPLALAWRCPAAFLRDRATGACALVAEPGAEALVEAMRREWAEAQGEAPPSLPAPVRVVEEDPARFDEAVARTRRYLAAGDLFQANLSRSWEVTFAEPAAPAALMARLRAANPAPFAGLLQWGGRAIVSASPERLLRVCGGIAESRPIAGTRPRAADAAADRARVEELLAHPKERAEHIMLVDLVRNDLGRVCRPGSVRAEELMTVESYRHVHHLVSCVRGELAPGRGPLDALAALFPGGTITGCPKLRAIEVIAELEREPRGPYTGGFGYLSRDGRMDFNILIRSVWFEGPRVARLRAGCGIVADSRPRDELAESRAKAAGLLRALGAG
ncbi:MAG: chorismate-binding protein [Xanthomonadales bacterium]|nr:chorismate-binding protein [Xanthomonadales bacterium]